MKRLSYFNSAFECGRFSILLVAVSCVLSSAGCGYFPWPETFGAVTPPNVNKSLNGLGVHKRMWETAGAKVLTPQKLSPRLDDMDVLVLVGTTYRPPGKLARDWLEQWLSEEEGRTVVYFGRDFDAEILYRQKTIEEVSDGKQVLARNALAIREAKEFANRLEETPDDVFCRWFYLRTSAQTTVHTKFSGEWANGLQKLEGEWPVTTMLEPPTRKLRSKKPTWLAPGATPKLTPKNPFSYGADATEELGDKEVQRSIWQPEEMATDEIWQKEWKAVGSADVLLAGVNGEPLIHRLTSSQFPRSQILIVANGAPFLNGTMVFPLHQKIGELIIEECLPADRVGLISYDSNGLLISQIDSDGNTNAGFELLTVWPLSAITMHAAFLGIVVCAVLLPILGRPQSLPRRSVTDFGLHVEALGEMLSETRDTHFAVRAIRDYFVKVRSEKPPEWLAELEATLPIPPVQFMPPSPQGIQQRTQRGVQQSTPPVVPPVATPSTLTTLRQNLAEASSSEGPSGLLGKPTSAGSAASSPPDTSALSPEREQTVEERTERKPSVPTDKPPIDPLS